MIRIRCRVREDINTSFLKTNLSPRQLVKGRGHKYFLPKDKFVTSPTGERYLRGPNGEKYVPDPRDDDRAIGPDGKLYDVSPIGEILPLGALQNFADDLPKPPAQIITPDGQIYLEDPEDERL
ncbi:hypothetical protein QE152_g3611 [Popillia japonica]|uniref:Uncharacterized protein n=1 Tax=Popillia japonica TaxID=7064 RepID=A0AAW1N3J5_POPJA